ncbi:Hypothetical protein PFCIRM516_05095 [Propionibacterium freudenreichii]|uniref:Uncharacterized protein n=1 Tax=Propionibacterium freudenreichii subsp. shermanii (strain ATCC 9614 / DSM 4902 / CIP 103027 / NCIMB 8099 / CIRM-BIA1) TaxID=754252 RepID=D7GF61_PROFC|nr:Hypothetical protein PFREUD_16690 [Propionibacterium freudenreichii subsp. shermanii CIRM-BIA1]CDP49559.1 Hypothetical protein PFCIRM129_00510 [Propionibacterium freudenreichii subsp. freudenreichii]CEG86121.1 Hypothetical protein PFCIRM118_04750 [Propionibacterium freudenreichii]CEG94846.1 Hypothetical protein PFCIRM123_05205 [Propionibacterium freudenreichii]CEH07603.1 Hypothetical protein PFCIRM135_11395 [Propionibacterium freudenreichii]
MGLRARTQLNATRLNAARRRGTHQQLQRVDIELLGQGLDAVEGEIALAALQPAQVSRRDAQELREALLCEPPTLTLGTKVRTEPLF